MRFTEIANPEEQLALWKLVSDKMWAVFGQQAQQQTNPAQVQQFSTSAPKRLETPLPRSTAPNQTARKVSSFKGHKHKKPPIAQATKPLPKPKAQQLTPTQAKKEKTKQYQQMAQQIQQAIAKKPLIQPYPQDPLPRGPVTTAVTPMNNSYDERDMDELVMHRRENPLKPRDLKNWGFDSKSHF